MIPSYFELMEHHKLFSCDGDTVPGLANESAPVMSHRMAGLGVPSNMLGVWEFVNGRFCFLSSIYIRDLLKIRTFESVYK